MKLFILLSFLLTSAFAQAQFSGLRPSTIRHFSKTMQKTVETDTAFRDKLAILLPDYPTKIRHAASDSAALDALLDATFLIRQNPDSLAAWLQANGVPRLIVPQLADYALYRFTNRTRPDSRHPAGFTYGLRIFKPHGFKLGTYIVRLEKDGKITLTDYDDWGTAVNTITGTLKGNRVIADDPRFANTYFFMEGVLGVSTIDNIGLAYYPCDRHGNFLQEPAPVFEDVTMSDMLSWAGIPEADISKAIAEKKSHLPLNVAEEVPPAFPGGDAALNEYLRRMLRYPEAAARYRKSGTVTVAFVVTAEGKVTNVRAIKKIGHGMDEEAVRVVSRMPDWRPGRHDGVPVNVQFILPVQFSIQQIPDDINGK